jgi:thioredoxin 1
MENLTSETFKEKVFDFTKNTEWTFIGNKPAIIDFYADWCGPCKMVAPILEELSKEYPNIDFYKIDTEAQNELAAVFGIRSIPSILFVPVTGMPQMTMGAQPKGKYKEAIKNIFNIE